MRKYVRRRTSPAAKITSALAAAILIPLFATLLHGAFQPFSASLARVDPALIDALSTMGKAMAYIASKDRPPAYIACIKTWRFGDLVVCKAEITKTQLERLETDKNVISVYGYKTYYAPFDVKTYASYTKLAEKIDIDNVFHKATGPWCGRGVVVAIIDTGIDYMHPDFYDEHNNTIIVALVSMIVKGNGHPLVWIPYVNGSMQQLLQLDKQYMEEGQEPPFLDLNGHGTHVAGIIAGRGWASDGKYVGIAPCAKLVIIKAFDRNGAASIDLALDALKWVYDNAKHFNISILNLSWGAAYASDGRDPLSLAADKIVTDKHVWVFAAAGNEGNFPTTIVVPAVARHVIAVGAWDAYFDRLAYFSSLGPTIDLRMKPDFVAAGVAVVAPASEYASFPDDIRIGKWYVALSGTSMATPVVAGIAADFIEYYTYWHGRRPTLSDFIRWEEVNGIRVDPLFKDFVSGYGIPVAPHS